MRHYVRRQRPSCSSAEPRRPCLLRRMGDRQRWRSPIPPPPDRYQSTRPPRRHRLFALRKNHPFGVCAPAHFDDTIRSSSSRAPPEPSLPSPLQSVPAFLLPPPGPCASRQLSAFCSRREAIGGREFGTGGSSWATWPRETPVA